AWSRDGALAYIAPVGSLGDRFQLTVRLASGQVSAADVGVGGGIGGVFPQPEMRFSPDGQLLLIAEPTTSDPYLQVRALDASLRFAPQVGTLQVADPATRDVRTILSGVHAWNPAAGPDGRYVVYEQRDPQADQFGGYGPPRLQAFDTALGKVVD